MSFASTRKMPKSFRENNTADYAKTNGVPSTIEKTLRRKDKRGSSLIQGSRENTNNDNNPYTSTVKSKTTSKALFSSKAYGSSSLVRPKRIVYPGGGECELEPMNHDAAKQKLETLFTNKDVK